MPEITLLYRPVPVVTELCSALDETFNIHSAKTLGEIISLVENDLLPTVILLDHVDVLSNDNILLHLYTIAPGAVFIMFCMEKNLAAGIQAANQNSFFRVFTEHTNLLTLQQILLDAQKQNTASGTPSANSKSDTIDYLTGYANRAAIFQHLVRQVTRATRYAQHISILICDIDGLKTTNDFMGYEAGDTLLKHFTTHINRQIRNDVDVIGRWGDDSFLVICPETTLTGAGKLAERLKRTLADNKLFHNQKEVKVKASYGISSYAPDYPDHNNTADQLILLAERCLMQAKAAGGDTILCCP